MLAPTYLSRVWFSGDSVCFACCCSVHMMVLLDMDKLSCIHIFLSSSLPVTRSSLSFVFTYWHWCAGLLLYMQPKNFKRSDVGIQVPLFLVSLLPLSLSLFLSLSLCLFFSLSLSLSLSLFLYVFVSVCRSVCVYGVLVCVGKHCLVSGIRSHRMGLSCWHLPKHGQGILVALVQSLLARLPVRLAGARLLRTETPSPSEVSATAAAAAHVFTAAGWPDGGRGYVDGGQVSCCCLRAPWDYPRQRQKPSRLFPALG